MFEYICDRCNKGIKLNHLWTVKFKYSGREGVQTKHFCTSCKRILDMAMDIDEESIQPKEIEKKSTYTKQADFIKEVEGTTDDKSDSKRRKDYFDLKHQDDEVPHFVDFMNSFKHPVDFMDVKTAKKVLALRLDDQKVSKIAKHFNLPYTKLYNFTEKYFSYTRNLE